MFKVQQAEGGQGNYVLWLSLMVRDGVMHQKHTMSLNERRLTVRLVGMRQF